MEFTISIFELLLLVVFATMAAVIFIQLNKIESKSDISNQQINKTSERVNRLEVLMGEGGIIGDMYSEISALRVHQRSKASPNTIIKFNVVDEMYREIFSQDRLSMEELRSIKFSLGLNGEIDESTKSSFIRTMLETQMKKGRLQDIVLWIRENRPDINI